MISTDKRSKLRAISSISGYSRRLVDYFVIVSSLPTKNLKDSDELRSHNVSYSSQFDDIAQNISIEQDMEDELRFEPIVTARYPLKDHSNGNPLHQSVATFCHPEGIIKLKSQPSLPKVHYFVMSGKRGTHTYGVCLTIYEPFKIVIRSGQEPTEIEMYVPKCICILSAYPYLVAFREYLTQLERLTKKGDMKIPLERYIVNFCAEIPAPPPGSFEVQATILDSVIKMWSPPHNLPIAWVSLPFSHLFECLDIDNIVTIWHALALEKQILVVSSQLTLLTTVCEILTSLLFPMRWSHAYIPLLPRFLTPILAAPTSFLVGVDRRYFNDALQHLSNDCIVVDLDNNQVNLGNQTQKIPRIPNGFERELKEVLEQNAGMIFREARSLRKEDDHSDRGQFLQLHVKEMSDAMWESKLSLYDGSFHLAFTSEQIKNHDFLNGNDNSNRLQSKWDTIQEAFLLIFVDLFQNYRRHLIFPSKDIHSSSPENLGTYGDFKSAEFLKSQRFEKRPFLKEFVMTQMFDDFITKRLYGSGASDVAFFDQAIDKYTKDKLISNMDPTVSSSLKAEDKASDISAVKRILERVRPRHNYWLGDAVEPLLQSAKVRSSLKTVVPPEPNYEGFTDDLEVGYHYAVFPSKFDKIHFSNPRPLPPVVIAEFDRQNEDTAQFRRKLKILQKHKIVSPEEATFTVFFVAYTAMIGRELVELYCNAVDLDAVIPSLLPSSTDDSESQDSVTDSELNVINEKTIDEHTSKIKFVESISSARIEEAKTIGRAQLKLAFEILDMMKIRNCNTEPIAYKYLIDSCGRCGDTDRATELLNRMHQDGIVADGIVYSCIVSAFSVDNVLGNLSNQDHFPDWTDGAPTDLNWNNLENKSQQDEKFMNNEEDHMANTTIARNIRKNVTHLIDRYKVTKDFNLNFKRLSKGIGDVSPSETSTSIKKFVTKNVAQQIGFGENLLEVIYKDISIDTDDEKCPKCGTVLLDDDVVRGWELDAQSYCTSCPTCKNTFVPKFRIQSTSPSFIGSKGPGTPLICERLSPWVLEKELKTKMRDTCGIEDLLDPSWREKEAKNAVLWWNLILSFMRYRLPFTFLLQGSFPQGLITVSPMPSTDDDE